MVYQQQQHHQQQRGGGGRERKRGNTRCLGCGYGCGQFGVEYITDDEHGSGRGYCSLDCYTSAKVTGRNLQTQARPRGGSETTHYNQRYRGSSSRMYGHPPPPHPQPWPTGLLVDAPPAPQPWRGRTRTLSQGSMSWRTAGSTSTSNLSSGDDSSSQESSLAEWQMGESEDGEHSVGSGSGSGSGNGVGGINGVRGSGVGVGCSGGDAGLPPAPGPAPGHHTTFDTQSSRRYERSGGRAAVSGNTGTRGHTNNNSDSGYAGGIGGGGGGGYPLRHGQMNNDRVDGTRRAAAPVAGVCAGLGGDYHRTTTRGDVTTTTGSNNNPRGEHKPPLAPIPVAPIPRMGAFPAQRRVHGTAAAGGGGGRRVEVRTVAFAVPPVQAFPPLTRPPSSSEGGAAVDKEQLPLPPPPASAAAAAGAADAGAGIEQQQQPEVVKKAAVGGGCGGVGVAPPGGNGKTDSDAGAQGPKSESAPAFVGDRAVAKEGLANPDEAAGAAATAKGRGTAEAAAAAAGGAGGGELTSCGAAGAGGVARATEQPEDNPKSLEQHMLDSCGPAIALPTAVVVRQWRRLFFP